MTIFDVDDPNALSINRWAWMPSLSRLEARSYRHNLPYCIIYSVRQDCIWVDIIRTYNSGQASQVLSVARLLALYYGKRCVRGIVCGRARLIAFRRHGCKPTLRVEDRGDDILYEIQLDVSPIIISI